MSRAGVPQTAFDYETHLIGPGAVYPRPVCYTLARRPAPDAPPVVNLVANGDGEPFWGDVERLIDRSLATGEELVFHNGPGFDLPVAAIHAPHLIPKIFLLLENGLVRDTMLREKLLNLATHGHVDKFFLPDGTSKDITYTLDRLTMKYLGVDRSGGKGEKVSKKGKKRSGEVTFEGAEKAKQGIWRFHFGSLDGLRGDQYPLEAREYAGQDTADTLLVREAQDSLARDRFTLEGAEFPDGTPFDVFKTEPLHHGGKFALSLMTHWEFGVDAAEVDVMEQQVARALAPERTKLLYESGLLTAARPEEPMWRRRKDGTLKAVMVKKTGLQKIKKAQKEKLSKRKLLELVQATWLKNAYCDEPTCPRLGKQCDEHGLPALKKTEPSKKFPDGQISTDGETISDLAPFDPVLDQYENRTSVQKLTTLYIPMLRAALKHGGVIHGGFDDLKRTGRISGRKSSSFPSFNATQVPRGFVVEYAERPGPDGKPSREKIEPRHCLVPRNPGWVFASVDFGTIELVTLAQQLFKHIGHSKMRDKINAGFDFHAFMGSQLAVMLDPDFAEFCTFAKAVTEDEIYNLFLSLKSGSKEEKDYYKKYRNFGKPTNLGLPGGLGPRTLIGYAKNTFGVKIASVEQGKQFKEVLIRVCPEIGEYLGQRGFVMRDLRDEKHSKGDEDRFAYFTPLGMYRANCTYTAAANGFALQSPAAEGGKIACFNLVRACWDPTMGSCLYGCRPAAFVHDEFIIEIPRDQWMHERTAEISRIMCDSMKVITPDMVVKAEPAIMDKGWDKNAEYVLGPDDRIRVWSAKGKYTTDGQGRLRSAS